eukprot:GHVO01044858.1.p1 GENE.GHVO01044858.1~~GHVO01044858.1.p1  ORF type:complete len:249 (+),score=48.72 GHVO01044858.1:34-747(+)
MAEAESAFSLTTFSPTGKLVQIEHALNAVNLQGRPALGVKTTTGVVIAAERKMTTDLVDLDTVHKVENFTQNIGVVFAGMPADYRVILMRGRKVAQAYESRYGESMPVVELVKQIAAVMQEYTQSGGVRPFGVSLLIAGCDFRGPQLYQVDPSGAHFAWKATAVGRDMKSARTFLENRYTDEMELEDGIHTAIMTLKDSFEGAMTETNIEVGIVDTTKRVFRSLSRREIKDYLEEVE